MKLCCSRIHIALVCFIITLQGVESLSNVVNQETDGTDDTDCDVTVVKGQNYFHSQLVTKKPHFVQFKIKQVGNTKYNVTKDVFEPFRWSWTYKESSGPFPFISWNLDYGILSFHLLETKTIYMEHEVELDVSENCNIHYGTEHTLRKIVESFIPLINISTADEDFPTYPDSYFCYYQLNRLSKANSFVSRYLIYNVGFIEYRCATVFQNFSSPRREFRVRPMCRDCIPKRTEWLKSSYYPNVISILALLYCSPIIVFSAAAWMAKYEKIIENEDEEEYEIIGELSELVNGETDSDDDWIYADGTNQPLTVSDVFNFQTLGLSVKYPIFMGRFRRFIFMLLVPSFIYLQLLMYGQGMGQWDENDKISVKDLVDLGAPMGFLSLLGDPKNRRKAFAYWLGGPVGVTCLYFALSFLFIVLPRSLKQIIHDGLPSTRQTFKSPLFLTMKQTMFFSKVINRYNPKYVGYAKAIEVIKCRFYMLFSAGFWRFVWTTQTTRWFRFNSDFSCTCILKWLFFILVYLIVCTIEISLCLIYYGIPFCSFVTIVVKGATKSLGYLKQQNRFLRVIFSFRLTIMFVFIVFIFYAFVISMLFVKSLLFICQVVTYCFVAVILYPSVAFGYLFFFTVILYYFIKLIQSFSDGYMELLNTAVDLSRHVDAKTDYIYNNDGHLIVFNLRISQIKDIKINGKLLDVSEDILKSLGTSDTMKVKEKNGIYGIPKDLFDVIVKELRPVHRELLSLSFNATVILVFVTALLSISASSVSGPTTEISEVMHVVFIVVVGALPKLVSSVVSHSHAMLLKEIEERQMKDTIIKYWEGVDSEMSNLTSIRCFNAMK